MTLFFEQRRTRTGPVIDGRQGRLCQASDPGKVRSNNEDAMGSFIPSSRHQVRSHGFLFAVADGVGGMDLGEVASATAISVITQEFEKAQDDTMLIGLMPHGHKSRGGHDFGALRWFPRWASM